MILCFQVEPQCFRQTCTAVVTGRRLRYARALQIIQNEEYLSALDLDDIRRKTAVRRLLSLNSTEDSSSHSDSSIIEDELMTDELTDRLANYG